MFFSIIMLINPKTDKAMINSQLQDQTESIVNAAIITTFNPDKDKSTTPKGILPLDLKF